MDNRQKILSDLEGLTFDDWHMYHSDTEVQGIAIDALELLKGQPQWISVKKKLPEQTGCYQVYRPNFWGEYGGQICVCYWDGKYWCDSYEGAGADGFELSPGDVSHWMPLPELPKE